MAYNTIAMYAFLHIAHTSQLLTAKCTCISYYGWMTDIAYITECQMEVT